MDPLKLIRAAFTSLRDTDKNPFSYYSPSGQAVESLNIKCTYITLPSGQPSPPFHIFPRTCVTNYRSKRGSGPHYPLDAICFLLERRDDSYTEYLQDARRLGLTIVSLTDKRELIEYLTTTESDTYAAIDSAAPLPQPLPHFPDTQEGRESKTAETETLAEPIEEADENKTQAGSSTAARPRLDTSKVKPVQTTAGVLKSDKDFTMIANAFKSLPLMNHSASTSSVPKGSLLDQISSMNVSNGVGEKHHHRQASASKPALPWIIILSAGTTALLTLDNVREFFENSRYVSVSEARAKGPKPALFNLKRDGEVFEFINNPARLTLSDWNRVLACFTISSTWQFKGWKWEDPVELFQHILGFHLYFDDMAVDSMVAGWNVFKLPLSRNRRHLDATAIIFFWERIFEAVRRRNNTK